MSDPRPKDLRRRDGASYSGRRSNFGSIICPENLNVPCLEVEQHGGATTNIVKSQRKSKRRRVNATATNAAQQHPVLFSSQAHSSQGVPHVSVDHGLGNIAMEVESEIHRASDQCTSITRKGTYKSRRMTSDQTEQEGLNRRLKKDPAAIGGRNIPTTYTSLPTPTFCAYCGATKFKYESEGFCCSNGEVRIATNEYPPELINLFTGDDANALHFRRYARMYNNVFAFSSLGGNFDCQTTKGIYVFKLYGQMYHFVPNLLPDDDNPKYLQLYFYDAEHEQENRLGIFPELKPEVVAIVMNVMKRNPYARFFNSMKDITISEDTQIILNTNSVLDQRVYNAPTAEEVAAVWLDDSSTTQTTGPYIVVHGKSDHSHRIQHYYGCYDPLQYPLLFPRGECGWHQGLKKTSRGGSTQNVNRHFPVSGSVEQGEQDLISEEARVAHNTSQERKKDISCREYYAYLFQIRPKNNLLRSLRLFQQYMVDMYVKIENTRLDFFRKNQQTIRADLYQGIVDVLLLGENNATNVGRRIILPPSFIGGPRDMKRRYLNSMALVQKYGKPDLFLTMTCNPRWPEIKVELAKGELAQNRPDLLARIFHAKLVALKKEIMDKKVFGEVAAMIHVVEFQKRGLPHAHFLIILKPEYKIKTPDVFDKYVSAELPSQENPHLRAAVIGNMLHGPCGLEHPTCACMVMKKGKRVCKSGYPKKFVEHTTNGTDSYPIYRRRNTGETLRIRKGELDNRWVIPYNPYLLAMFDCHINVEVCSTIQAVKYLYKYVYKGHDRVSFNVVPTATDNVVDEIERYQSGRWVSPPEAAWRIFGFDLFGIYPAVLPLQVHTENMQFVSFQSNEDLQSVVDDERRSRTMLTDFFRVNAERTNGPQYLYKEFPEHFVWDASLKTWKSRKRGIVVGRLTYAAPGEGERYYLRLLLSHVRGPKSFDDLLTVDGAKCATFQESALKRGLLEQDDSLDQCMTEAIEVEMPRALRRLFATILIFCQPNAPKEFWQKYYTALSEDFRRSYPNDDKKVLQLTAQKVEQFLEGMGKSFSDFGLDHLHQIQDDMIRRTRDVVDALEAPIPSEYVNARKELNNGQRVAYKTIIQCVKSGKSGAFFIDGPGGTGKTFLYCALYAKVRLMGKICIPTASSGIAASNIPTGRTAHSRFKIPVDNNGSVSCDVPKQGSLAILLREASLIIWDEASMAEKINIEAVDSLLQDLCSNKELFGGKVIVFGGDFRQVLPVLPRKTQLEAVEASIVSSYLWPKLVKFQLTQNIRAKEDPEFSNFLLQLGNGALQTHDSGLVSLSEQVMLPWDEGLESIRDLVKETFPEIEDQFFSPQIFTQRTILTPKNDDVDSINKWLIDQYPGTSTVYKSFDSMINDNCSIYPSEFLNTLCPGGMSPHELILKENCPVILLRNLDPAGGLCNGTRLICKKFYPNMIQCEISTGCYKGEIVFLPRITLKPSTSASYPFQFQRRQFPIKLSFAMTINKAQGQTLQQVGVYLPQPCFSHGQLYVALSRARSTTQLRVTSRPPSDQTSDRCLVKNVISFEILKRAGAGVI